MVANHCLTTHNDVLISVYSAMNIKSLGLKKCTRFPKKITESRHKDHLKFRAIIVFISSSCEQFSCLIFTVKDQVEKTYLSELLNREAALQIVFGKSDTKSMILFDRHLNVREAQPN